MRFSNLHQHSTFSDGKNTPEEVVLSAIEKNMESIGFSDHSFTEIDQSYCMKLERYKDYYAEINRLKEKYKDKITVFLGIEKDYYSEIERDKFDYVIASVHYIYANGVCHPIDHSKVQQETYIATECDGDILKFARDYYELVIKNVRDTKPDVVGHFDVISKFGLIDEDNPEYREIAKSALSEVLKVCPVIEMNTGAISRRVKDIPYPHPFLLEFILKNGGEIMLSADSHAKETVCFYFEECVEMLKKIGFTHIVKLTENGMVREAI